MMNYGLLSDPELATLIKQGNQAAYEEIYERYWVVLYRHARRLLQNEEESRDVVQDVFVMLWSKRTVLNDDVSPSSLLYSAVKNKILDIFKHSKVASNHLESLKNFKPEPNANTDHLVREHQLAKIIEDEIAMLPDRMREVFELKRKLGLSHKEIAERMNISEPTVKTQMNRAIKTLKTRLGDTLFSSAFPFL